MKFAPYDWYRQTLRNPKYRWWIVLATFAYLVLPFDLLPDLIPFVGQIDDVVVVTLLFSELSQILIDRIKAGKGEETAQTTVADASTVDTAPVDVKAVSVE